MLTNEFRTVMQRYTFTHQNRYTFPADNCTIPPLPLPHSSPRKDGTRLRVSLNGYRLLRQRLGI